MRQIGNVHHFSSKGTTLIRLHLLIKSCAVVKKKKDEGGDESSVLKMILNLADRDALISCFTKWSFF